MALRLGALQDALIEAGATDETAKRAAEELATYEGRLGTMDSTLADIRGDLKTLTWMVGTLIVLTIGHFFLTWNILTRLPR